MPANIQKDFIVRSQLEVANNTAQSNLSTNTFVLGEHNINSSAHAIGPNVVISTSHLRIGNTTANLIVNSISIAIANSSSALTVNLPTAEEVSSNVFLAANGSWVNPSVLPAVGTVDKVYKSFVATADQTIFNITGGWSPGKIEVYYNGAHLANTEYIEDTPNITLNNPAHLGAVVEIVGYQGAVVLLTAQGNDTDIQFNEGGNLGANGNFRWQHTINKLTVGNTTINVSVNTSFIQLANATVAANIHPLGMAAGNSTIYVVANTTLIKVANTIGSANISPHTIAVGNSTIYTTIGTTLSHTGSNTFTLGTSTKAANGYSFLPNGLIMQWGSVSITTGGVSAAFTVAFPTALASITATPTFSANGVFVSSSNTTQATIACRSGSGICFYTAIGY